MSATENDIESELSYAYLHSVAARCGCECKHAGRLVDNRGIDATVMGFRDYGPNTLSQVTLLFQLKATRKKLTETRTHIAFDLDIHTYNRLRTGRAESAVFLLLLSLPPDQTQWLRVTKSALTLKRCAYWLSLHNAEASPNPKHQRVYLPKRNRLTETGLEMLLETSAREQRVPYDRP